MPGQFQSPQGRADDLDASCEEYSIPEYYYREGYNAALHRSNPNQGESSVQSTPRRPQAEYSRSTRTRTRSRSPVRYNNHEADRVRQPRSPTRPPRQDSLHLHKSPDGTRPPTKGLTDVTEEVEYDSTGQLPGHYSPYIDSPLIDSPAVPPKRSRSPMKKMFGEKGWLGLSPDEKIGQNLKHNKSFLPSRDEPVHGQKKTSMMSKIKNKFEEIVSVLI